MRILILTAGSRGDVAPFTGLGQRLQQAGHQVALAAHGRFAEGSAQDNPVIETVLQISAGSVQEVHPLLAAPFDVNVETRMSGLKDFKPKPWPERFREIQAAGGHVEIVRSRVQQGDLVSVAAGTLSLNAQGRIDGELQMTVAGIEKVIPLLGIGVALVRPDLAFGGLVVLILIASSMGRI